MSQGRSTPLFFGMVIPPLIGNPYNGYVNRGLMTIPYFRETINGELS